MTIQGEREGGSQARARAPLGVGLRLVELYLALNLCMIVGYALVIPAPDFDYDLTFFNALITGALSSVALWLIERRASLARQLVPWGLVGLFALLMVDLYVWGGFSAHYLFANEELAIWVTVVYLDVSLVAALYVAFSRRVGTVLVESLRDPTARTRRAEGDGARGSAGADDTFVPRPLSWPWWRNLGIYYAVATLVGHWGEILFCLLIVAGVFEGDYDFGHEQLWTQWLYPYPAEGIAMVLCVVVLYPFKEWLLKRLGGRVLPTLVVSFLVIMVVCASVDFLTGITTNADYHLWDYRDLPFNFMGQIVLQNTLVYSVAATAVVWVVYPFLGRLFARAQPALMDAIFFALAGSYAFLEVLYFIYVSPAGIVFG